MEFKLSFRVSSDGIRKHDNENIPIDENAQREVYRMASFKNCKSLQAQAVRLAMSGFYYIGHEDKVMCFCCGVIVEHFQPVDNPRAPQWHQPTCKFMLGEDSGNKPLSETTSTIASSSGQLGSSASEHLKHEAAPTKPASCHTPHSSNMLKDINRRPMSGHTARLNSREGTADISSEVHKSGGNFEGYGYFQVELPERLTPTHIDIRKQAVVSSHDDIQIQIGMSASIPGTSGLSKEITHVKKALPQDPISSPRAHLSFFKTASYRHQSSAEIGRQNIPLSSPSLSESESNSLEISSKSWNQLHPRAVPAKPPVTNFDSQDTLRGISPEISLEPTKTYGKPTFPPSEPMLTYPSQKEVVESSPNSLLLSFLGKNTTTTVQSPAAPTIRTSSTGFVPIKSPVGGGSYQSPVSPLKLQHHSLPSKTSAFKPKPATSPFRPLPYKSLPSQKQFPETVAASTSAAAEIGEIPPIVSPTKSYEKARVTSPLRIQLSDDELAPVSSTLGPLLLPGPPKPPALQKVFPPRRHQTHVSVPNQQEATVNFPTQLELLDEFDPVKSSEIELPLPAPEKVKLELDVGQYVLEPFKSLLIEEYPCLRPAHPEWGTVARRIDKFPPGFPVYESLATITDIAEAGFYSVGSKDEVRCWYCGMEAVDWCEELDPWTKHCLESPSCEYLLRNRGADFVSRVSKDPALQNAKRSERRVSSTQSTSTIAQPSLTDEEFRTMLTNCLQSELTTQLVMMGFEKKVLIQLTKERIRKSGGWFENIEQALDDLERIDQDLIVWNSDEDEDLLPDPPELEAAPEPEMSSRPRTATPPASREGEEPRRSRMTEVEERAIRRELKMLKDEKRCKVCLDRDSCMIFVPCGHICACVECTASLRRCPICREYIDRAYHTYAS